MGLARSTYHDTPTAPALEDAIVTRIRAIGEEFEAYGYRRIATTDSDHEEPVFPNLAPAVVSDGPDKLWVADITYVPIIGSFVYVAVILDAWSRRVVGC